MNNKDGPEDKRKGVAGSEDEKNNEEGSSDKRQIQGSFLICLSGESSTPEACMRLRQLLGVEHVLVKEYAGDIRSKINAMAE